MRLTFRGATGTVTGSKYLVEHAGRRVLVDCGLFQGLKELRLRNWSALPVGPEAIDAVVLTHAHIDHSGFLPRTTVRAEVASLQGLSAHADRDGLVRWIAALPRAPRHVYVTHGEPQASDALRQAIEERHGWPCSVPDISRA